LLILWGYVKLKEVDGKKKHRIEISNRLEALENIDTDVDIYIYIGLGKLLERRSKFQPKRV
jgi:hypothetical protein